jgi:hypothetical protein
MQLETMQLNTLTLETTPVVTAQPESFEIVHLNPSGIGFAYDGENLTYSAADGTHFACVSLRRCFPLSGNGTHILVRVPDTDEDRGYELGIIDNVQDLAPASREAVERELGLFYFVPVVRRITSIREEFGFLYWSVETDRGKKDFIMRDNITSSTRKVSGGRWLLIDINQTRYEVRDYESLDAQSQKLLKRYLLL